jgi:hypothetical protein
VPWPVRRCLLERAEAVTGRAEDACLAFTDTRMRDESERIMKQSATPTPKAASRNKVVSWSSAHLAGQGVQHHGQRRRAEWERQTNRIYVPARTAPRGLPRDTKPIEIAIDMALPRIKTYLTGNLKPASRDGIKGEFR